MNDDAFSEKNLEKAGYASNPLEDGSLDDYQVARDPDDDDDREAVAGIEPHDARRRPLDELLRARPDVVGLPPSGRVDLETIQTSFANRP